MLTPAQLDEIRKRVADDACLFAEWDDIRNLLQHADALTAALEASQAENLRLRDVSTGDGTRG